MTSKFHSPKSLFSDEKQNGYRFWVRNVFDPATDCV
jgi:hypothetical protein